MAPASKSSSGALPFLSFVLSLASLAVGITALVQLQQVKAQESVNTGNIHTLATFLGATQVTSSSASSK